jgi:tetratricopeptide (TPR) repeat protein
MMKYPVISVLLTATAFAAVVQADIPDNGVARLQKDWAVANYQSQGKARKQAFEALVEEADATVTAHPDSADAHIWAGIVYSTYAGEVSMFSAGKQVKRARAELEEAIEIDPNAMHGSAFTSLGALLYQIPGFMGGDDEEAEGLLKKGLELNPDGIDSNYFYGTFLIDQKRYDEALVYLKKAQAAPDRPSRPVADKGRRKEIAEAMEEVRKKTS